MRRSICVLILFTFAVGCLDYFEVSKSHYTTLSEAEEKGVIERGWLPLILPPSTRNIYEKHDLDTNQGYFKFEYDVNETEEFLSHLEKVEHHKVPKSRFEDSVIHDATKGFYQYYSDRSWFHFHVDEEKGKVHGVLE